MKRQIIKLDFGSGEYRYIIKVKRHWYSRWRYIMDGTAPRLYSESEIKMEEINYGSKQ